MEEQPQKNIQNKKLSHPTEHANWKRLAKEKQRKECKARQKSAASAVCQKYCVCLERQKIRMNVAKKTATGASISS